MPNKRTVRYRQPILVDGRKTRIMGEDLSQEQWEADLEGVAWCLGWWDELDERAARIRAILAGPG